MNFLVTALAIGTINSNVALNNQISSKIEEHNAMVQEKVEEGIKYFNEHLEKGKEFLEDNWEKGFDRLDKETNSKLGTNLKSLYNSIKDKFSGLFK